LASKPFESLRFFFEFNYADQDLGIQMDLHPGIDYTEFQVLYPSGKEMFDVDTGGTLSTHGLGDLFFESAEPNFKDVPLDVILKRFPEGNYTFKAENLDGPDVVSKRFLSHDFPDPAKIIYPRGTDADPRTVIDVVKNGLRVKWTAVKNIPLDSYEVIVTDQDDPELFAIDQRVKPTKTSVLIDKGFFLGKKNYEVEVLARAKNGNQIIDSQYFKSK
jgi:hypothetical protein